HGLFILGNEADAGARDIRPHLMERLHHLDQPDHVAHGDGVAIGLERRLVGGRGAVERAGKGGKQLSHGGTSQIVWGCTAARTARAMSMAFGVSEWMQMLSQRTGMSEPSIAVPLPSVIARRQRA